MQLTTTLLLLPLAATAVLAHDDACHDDVATANTDPAGVVDGAGGDGADPGADAYAYARRGITDRIKVAFGDPVAMANGLSRCMTACARTAAETMGCDGADVDCLCKKGKVAGGGGGGGGDDSDSDSDGEGEGGSGGGGSSGGDDVAGGQWEGLTKQCLDGAKWYSGCGGDDEFEKGKLLEICKAVGDKPGKKNETQQALGKKFEDKHLLDGMLGLDEKEGESGELGPESGAAGVEAGVVARAAGFAVAAVLGYAIAGY